MKCSCNPGGGGAWKSSEWTSISAMIRLQDFANGTQERPWYGDGSAAAARTEFISETARLPAESDIKFDIRNLRKQYRRGHARLSKMVVLKVETVQ